MKSFIKIIFIIISTMIFVASTLVVKAQQEIEYGDIFVSLGKGQIQWYRNDGTFVMSLNTGYDQDVYGMAVDTSRRLLVTNFLEDNVSMFDKFGNHAGIFESNYGIPLSLIIDTNSNVYVGNYKGGIFKYDFYGDFIALSPNLHRVRWMDILGDQCTILYDVTGFVTGEGPLIEYKFCTDSLLADIFGRT